MTVLSRGRPAGVEGSLETRGIKPSAGATWSANFGAMAIMAGVTIMVTTMMTSMA